MHIPEKYPQFLDSEALLIVAGKTIGVIYRIKDGAVTKVETLEQPLESYSDDEGFFFGGAGASGGAPKERDDVEAHIHELRKRIGEELDRLVKQESARVLYVFEPEHLKGRIIEELQQHPDLTIHSVAYGNFQHETPLQLLERIDAYSQAHTVDTDVDFEQDLKRYS